MPFNIKQEWKARAYTEINALIDEGERILETCSLENFSQRGGADAKRATIIQWLAKAEGQTRNLLVNPEEAMPFSAAHFNEQIEALDPQPPSVAQLRHVFGDLVNEKLGLLNAMIGRETEE